ncbi:MAG: class I SAM-dependent methyltransferase [Bacteroidales bacterium]|nr:class I SAM-dependent methyltransferase [Bacteroidales bacterium]
MSNNFETDHYENPSLWIPDRFGLYVKERVDLALEWMPPGIKTILDAGCGNGVYANRFLADKSITTVVGVDRSYTALSQVQVDRSQANIIHLPFPDQTFDLVVSMEIIEHLPYRMYEQGLGEILRVAKKYILITVPYNEKIYYKQVKCPICGCIFHPDFHSRSFNYLDMKHLFESWEGVTQLRIQKIVKIKELLLPGLWKTMRRIYLKGRDFPSNALCPQCGYSIYASNTEKVITLGDDQDDGIQLKSRFRRLWPKRTTYCWWMALYEKMR